MTDLPTPDTKTPRAEFKSFLMKISGVLIMTLGVLWLGYLVYNAGYDLGHSSAQVQAAPVPSHGSPYP